MKTYHGQMTKEQLDKTYYHAANKENAKAFAAMCAKAGFTTGGIGGRDNVLIGVNTKDTNSLGWIDFGDTYYEECKLAQIHWTSEELKPSTDYLYPLISSVKTSIKEAETEVSKWSGKVKEGKEELENLLRQLEKSVEDGTEMECKVFRAASSTSTDLCYEVPIPEGVDIHDYTTWEPGDVIVCTHHNGSAAVVGKEYIYIESSKPFPIGILKDAKGKQNSLSTTFGFQFVRRPDYATVLRP